MKPHGEIPPIDYFPTQAKRSEYKMATKDNKETKGINTSEYMAVHDNYQPLVNRLQHVLVDMAGAFYSKKLISNSEHGDAVSSKQPHQQIASTIMSSIMTKIQYNTEWYYVLMDVLNNSSMKDIGKDIANSKALDDQDKYSPLLSNESKTATSLPPQSTLHNPGPGSTPANKLEPSCEGDSAYSESQTDSQYGDDIPNDVNHSISTLTSAHPMPNDSSFLKVTTKCAEESRDLQDRTKHDLETGLSSGHSGDHTECKHEMADLNMEKEKLQAEIKCLETKHNEERKAKRQKTQMLSQLQAEVIKRDNIIENLKSDQIKKDEEIRRLRSEKEAMDTTIRELNAKYAEKEEREVETIKAEYQAKIDFLTRELAKAEEEKTKALQNLEASEKELDDVKKKEEVAQIEIERMNTKLAKLELQKEKEVNKYKLINQRLQFQIEKESETKKAELATKDKELAEAKIRVLEIESHVKIMSETKKAEMATNDKELAEAQLKDKVMENEDLRKQMEELKLKNNQLS